MRLHLIEDSDTPVAGARLIVRLDGCWAALGQQSSPVPIWDHEPHRKTNTAPCAERPDPADPGRRALGL